MKISEQDGAVIFEIRVVPRSSKSEIVGEIDGVIKIKLKAPPVNGAMAGIPFVASMISFPAGVMMRS